MEICFIAGTLGRGGAECQLIYMLRTLRQMGVGTRVLCLTRSEAFEGSIRDLGVEVEWVGSSRNRLIRMLTIINNIRNRPADIVQSSHFYTNIYAALASRVLGLTSIGAIRSDLTSEISANGVFGRWDLKLPRWLVANSQLAVDRAITAGIEPANIHLVRNAVEDTYDRPPLLKSGGVTLLFAGRLVPEKRPELFIDLASELLERHPRSTLKFLVAGDGPLRSLLVKKAAEKGIRRDEISFLGEESEMSEVYRRADILVLTSKLEGIPNVVLEAMASGLPVIVTRVGGIPEIVDEERGLVVDPHDFSGLVEATSLLIHDKRRRLRMGKNGRVFVRKYHSISYLQRELTKLYSEIL